LSHGVPTAGLGLARTGRVLRHHERLTRAKVAPQRAASETVADAHGARSCLLYLQLPFPGA